MKDVVIVGALRTAIGCFQGALARHSAVDLGSVVVKALVERSGIAAHEVDEVILGQVLTAGAGQNPARQAALKGGLPNTVSAITINDVCGSGLKALHLATQAIQCGEADVIIAGGQENMSLSPHAMHLRAGVKMGNAEIEPPKSISTATAVTAQIIAQVASHIYGGTTINRIDEVLAPDRKSVV